MNILIIGGTRFQGPHLVRDLLAHGHTVTVFHRGSNFLQKNLQATEILGDRDSLNDLSRLRNFNYDACIDTCAYHPEQIGKLAIALKVDQYILISSVYVYEDHKHIIDEECQVNLETPPNRNSTVSKNYGHLKALCEIEAIKHFGEKSLLIRPSSIIGPGDHTERLKFWFRMTAIHHLNFDFSGLSKSIQLIDVRDLSNLVVNAINQKKSGPINVCGESMMFNDLITAIMSYKDQASKSILINENHLSKTLLEKIPYLDSGFNSIYSNQKSKEWGFNFRCLNESLDDFYLCENNNQFSLVKLLEQETLVLKMLHLC